MSDGVVLGEDGVPRCWWCGADAEYVRYHDEEWGRPVADDRRLFEKICLEGFQSGLSWITILRKRAAFREVFHNFDIDKVAAMGAADVERLLGDARIIRHRKKIEAAIANAAAARAIRDADGAFAPFLWRFAPDAAPIVRAKSEVRAATPESEALSKALKTAGFRFVGPTTAYAFMQSIGMVNDHLEGCALHAEIAAAQNAFARPS